MPHNNVIDARTRFIERRIERELCSGDGVSWDTIRQINLLIPPGSKVTVEQYISDAVRRLQIQMHGSSILSSTDDQR